MDGRQFDVILGISRKMEETLSKIERHLANTLTEEATPDKAQKGALSGVASSVNSIISAIGSKKFDSKRAENILEFSKGIVSVSNSINPGSAKAFSELASSFSTSFEVFLDVMNPLKMMKLYFASEILLGDKTPLLQRIAESISVASKEFASIDPKSTTSLSTFSNSFGLLLGSFDPIRLIMLQKMADVLFDGNNPLIKRIVNGISDATYFLSTAKEGSSKIFSEFAVGFSSFMNALDPKNLMNLSISSKILFGKEKLLEKIVYGISKVFSNLESIDPNSVKALSEFSNFLLSLSNAMNPLKILQIRMSAGILFGNTIGQKFGAKSLLERIVSGMNNSFKDLDSKKAKEGSEAIKLLGEGLISLSKALKSFILIGIAAPLVTVGALVVRAVIGLFSSFGKHAKEIKEGGDALKSLGKGLIAFSAGLATAVLVVAIAGPIMVAGVIGTIALFGLTFWAIGKASNSIIEGARALAWAGLALFGFSAGLATFMLVMMIVKPVNILVGIGIIASFSLLLSLIGIDSISKNIARGALLLIGMGFAVAVFSLGLLIFGKAVQQFTWETALLGAALILGFGISISIIGMLKKSIIAGSLALSEMGIGLAIFSVGIIAFGLAIKVFNNVSDIVLGSIAIIALGSAFALIGNFAFNIIDGSLAITEMGISLISLSLGILVFGTAIKLLQLIFKNDLIIAGAIAGSMIIGLGISFAAVGAMSRFIIPGAASMITVGISLIAISAGIIIFALAIKELQKLFKGDLERAGKIAGGILIGLGLAFAAVGLASPLILLGSASVILMGASLIIFSTGFILFALAAKGAMGLFGDGIDKIGIKTRSFFSGLAESFAYLGLLSIPIILGSSALVTMGASLLIFGGGLLVFGQALNSLNTKGLLVKENESYTLKGISVISGIADHLTKVGVYALNPFYWTGIAASIGLGASLFAIGTGLKQAAEALAQVTDMDKLISNLFGESGLINAMADQFANIGKKYGGGLLTSWMGADPVSVGIKSVKGFGDVLTELAGGIVAFSNFSEFPVKIPDAKDPSKLVYSTVDIFTDILPSLNSQLPILLSSLATVFADIGTKFGGEGGWFGDDSPVQKGVDAVKGLGTVLSELAGGIVSFSRFDEFPIQIPDPKDPSKLIYKAIPLYDAIPKIKAALIGDGTLSGKLTAKSGILLSLAEIFAEIGNKWGDGFFSDGPVKKGVEAVQGIGGVISELAQGIIAFASMDRGLPNYDEKGKFLGTYTSFDIDLVKIRITELLNSLPSVFATINVEDMEAAQEKANAAIPLAKAISSVGKHIQDLIVDKEGKKESIVALIGTGIKQFVDDVKNLEIDTAIITNLKNLGISLKEFSSIEQTITKQSSGIKDVYKTIKDLTQLNDPLTKLFKTIQSVGNVEFGKGLLSFFTGFVSQADSVFDQLSFLNSGFEKLVEFGSKTTESLQAIGEVLPHLSAEFSKFILSIESVIDGDKLISLTSALSNLSALKDPLRELAISLNNTGTAFLMLNIGFGKFATQLEKFSKFEKSFSALSMNAHNYQFDKFATSMGTLKKNVNEFSIENLKLTDSLMKSLAILSKSPDTLGEKIKESIEDAMKLLAEAIKEVASNSSAQTSVLDKIASFSFSQPAPVQQSAIPITKIVPPSSDTSKSQPDQNTAIANQKLDRVAIALEALASKLQTGEQGALKVIDIHNRS